MLPIARVLPAASCDDTAVRVCGTSAGSVRCFRSSEKVILMAPERRCKESVGKQSKERGEIPLYCDDQIMGGAAAEEELQDLIEGVDEDGNTVLLQVERYFFYNGEEYVVLGDAHVDDCDCEECEECDHNHEEDEPEAVNLYIMKVVETEEDGEEMEEFLPVDDEDLLEKLIEVVQADFEADEAFDDE